MVHSGEQAARALHELSEAGDRFVTKFRYA